MNEPSVGRWLAKPLKPRRRFVELLGWGGFLILPLALYGQFVPWPAIGVRIVVACSLFGAYYAALIVLPLIDPLALLRTRRDRALSDGVPKGEEHPVEVVVWNGAKKVGADRGLAWFDGPLLGFSGERMSFLLAVDELRYPKGPMLSDWDLAFYPLKPKIPGSKARVEVRPLLGHGRDYRKRFRAFLRAGASSEAERQWPPFEPFCGIAPAEEAR